MKALCPVCRAELPPLPGVPASRIEDVAAALEGGNKIEAIKLVRELTSAGLKEAKDYVECPHPAPTSVRPPAPAASSDDPLRVVCPGCEQALPPIPGVPTSALADVAALLVRGEKIQAIKLMRELTSAGLKESKDYVECPHALPGSPVRPSSHPDTVRHTPISCIVVGVGLLLLVAGVIVWLIRR